MTRDSKQGPVALGIDFGGTAIKIGLVAADGRILQRRRLPTASAPDPDSWIETMCAVLPGLLGGRALDTLGGVGVGVPGFVDFESGFIHELTNVPGWEGVRLGERLSRRLQLPVAVDNDVNAMALGEYTHGAGRGLRHAVFVTLGTGVGGAVIIDNKIYRGAYSMAGEIGHVSINRLGLSSPRGRGGLEEYVGNQPLVARVVRELRRGRQSSIPQLVNGRLEAIDPKVIEDAARDGDELAVETYEFMADCLATAFASVTYLLQPRAIIVGGGVAASGEILFGPLERFLHERLSPHFADRLEIRRAALGNDAGMIGAARLSRIIHENG